MMRVICIHTRAHTHMEKEQHLTLICRAGVWTYLGGTKIAQEEFFRVKKPDTRLESAFATCRSPLSTPATALPYSCSKQKHVDQSILKVLCFSQSASLTCQIMNAAATHFPLKTKLRVLSK